MVIDLLTTYYNLESDGSGGGNETIDTTNITKLKQGDTTIKMKSDTTLPTGHTLNLDNTFNAYNKLLSMNRRPI
jgi:hypothetical protein